MTNSQPGSIGSIVKPRSVEEAIARRFHDHHQRIMAMESSRQIFVTPIQYASYNNPLSVSATPIMNQMVTVPEGCTSAALFLNGDWSAGRPAGTAGTYELGIQLSAGASAYTADYLSMNFPTATLPGYLAQSFSIVLTGADLPAGGSQFPIAVAGDASGPWLANSGSAHLNGICLFLR